MVPLTGQNAFEEKDAAQSQTKSKQEPEVERVKLGKTEGAKIGAWLKQLDDSSNGFLQLTKSDLVNFMIRERKEDLSAKEIAQIRANNYDPIRHLNWITPRLKDALSSGDMDQIARLQEEIRGIELSVVSRVTAVNGGLNLPRVVKQKRVRRRKKVEASELQQPSPTDDLASIRDGPSSI